MMNIGLQTGRPFQRLLINIVEIKYFELLLKLLDCLVHLNSLIVYDIVYVPINNNNEKKFDNK